MYTLALSLAASQDPRIIKPVLKFFFFFKLEDWSQERSSSSLSFSKYKMAKTQILAMHLNANSYTESVRPPWEVSPKEEVAVLLVTISPTSERP